MRRALITAGVVIAIVVVAFLVFGGGDKDSDHYRVRAVFDNGGFVVHGENVRVAGANVGAVKSVDISMPGEVVSYKRGVGATTVDGEKGYAIPGKAIVVLDITDPGFEDFRADASCLIRPQSLIGEKFVDCTPTQGRAPGTPPPPALQQIPSGQPGAGQYLLPLENNGKAVDLDLIQNIQRLPYRERFRLILNDLGAGLAGRGADIRDIVRRANPALRETGKVLSILAGQNKQLAQLALDSDTDLAPLARERQHISGFIRNSGAVAEATASRSADLETNINKLPATLTELRLTMGTLGKFSNAARPFFSTLGGAAPEIAKATRQLAPFSEATTLSLKSLGNAAQQAQPDLVASDPIVRKLRGLATTAQSPAQNLGRLTKSLRAQHGFNSLMKLIYNTAGTFNGYDQYGHYQRTNILVSGCAEYSPSATPGCVTRFTGPGVQQTDSSARQDIINQALRDARTGGSSVPDNLPDNGDTSGLAPSTVPGPEGPVGPTGATGDEGVTGDTGTTDDTGATDESGTTGETGTTDAAEATSGLEQQRGFGERRMRTGIDVLDYLLGP